MHSWSAAVATVDNLALTNLASLADLVCLLINHVLFMFPS